MLINTWSGSLSQMVLSTPKVYLERTPEHRVVLTGPSDSCFILDGRAKIEYLSVD